MGIGLYKINIRLSFLFFWFVDVEKVKVLDLGVSGYILDEVDYGIIGGGLGSFIWVDFLRIFGVSCD